MRVSSHFLKNLGFISAHERHSEHTRFTSSTEKGKLLHLTKWFNLITPGWLRVSWIFKRLRGELRTIVDPHTLEKVSGAVLSIPGLCW